MIRKHTLPALVAMMLAAVAMLILPSHGDTGGWKDTFSPRIPPPTGSHEVGVRHIRVVDTDRADPWRPEGRRELMVDVHYPADPGNVPIGRFAVAAAMTELGSLEWAPREEKWLGLLPDEVNWMFRTHAREWMPPAAGEFPVVILSTPPGMRRSSFTGLAEDLASRGYAVVSIDHPYDSPAVELLPTRRVVTPAKARVHLSRAEANAVRADDIGWVTSHLRDIDDDLAGSFDRGRIALAGWVGAGTPELSRLGALPGVKGLASVGSVGATGAGAGATPYMAVRVANATARGLTDDGIVLTQIADVYPRAKYAVAAAIGTAEADGVQRIVRSRVAAFLDTHLR